ncbi:hypothetical protein [Plastoroseomonas arctica]|uniref:Uncharacterized protein n=1 Tax=Plastoroseomonas arctica TaxID=1509237 RepID=A0AAF1KP80_9PROT|nr:hypothetical protein [Plastoroseomonas arctica]MBR0655528.1 hypothetical protein [Plastoroseomonas arctica]
MIKMEDREALLEAVGYEARLAYIAFCAERCFAEAQRHKRATEQLGQEPLLREGVELLWAAARGSSPEPARVAAVRERVATFEKPDPGGEKLVFKRDFALVAIARVLTKGMRVLAEPGKAKPAFIVGVLDGPGILMATIYHNAMECSDKEIDVIDLALARLHDATPPIDRSLFDGIPDWTRGKVARLYAAGGVTDTLSEED